MPRDIKKVRFPESKGNRIYIAIIVPSTSKKKDKQGNSIYIGDTRFNARIKSVRNFLSKFGGYTSYSATGGWMKGKTTLIKEKTVKVETYTKPQRYGQRLTGLKKFLKTKKRVWGQDELAFIFEEEMHFI